VFRALSKEVRDTCGIKGNVSVPPAGILQLMLLLILIYTACHNNVPKKGWRHKCCSKKTFRNRNVFLTTNINPLWEIRFVEFTGKKIFVYGSVAIF
jgi:hypothetical protein